MNAILLSFVLLFVQSPVTVVKNNGDQVVFSKATFYQKPGSENAGTLKYFYRGEPGVIKIGEIKRISFKEVLQKKKGITTYKAILVRSNNTKLEISLDLVKMEGVTTEGKNESMNFSSVDKISF